MEILLQEQLIPLNLEPPEDTKKMKKFQTQQQRNCRFDYFDLFCNEIYYNQINPSSKIHYQSYLIIIQQCCYTKCYFLFTFWDGFKALVLDAIQIKGDHEHSASPFANIINQKRGQYWIGFKNEAFSQNRNQISKIYWDMAYKSFNTYNEKILKKILLLCTHLRGYQRKKIKKISKNLYIQKQYKPLINIVQIVIFAKQLVIILQS
ncbi:unnamed protein product [Paramecium primaurelia]|uniref:Uncharacterized protein n=1 Tax=Paramecium primaurelia TaxID=5886 RepID=A0A8S1PHN7_PARPR|nr:unnamed protein product [Paramecium primaurelia]